MLLVLVSSQSPSFKFAQLWQGWQQYLLCCRLILILNGPHGILQHQLISMM